MNINEKLLEAIVEAIRARRRYGMVNPPKFPTPFDLSRIGYVVPDDEGETPRIEMDLVIDGKSVKVDLLLVPALER
jgi:hypothetical protein